MEMKRKNPKLILGFVGKLCVGKGEAISYLVNEYGFYASSCSDRIREEIKRSGQEITRERLLETGGKLRKEHGPEVLAKRTWENILQTGTDKAVIDSIRGIEEVKFLKTLPSFYLIALEADQEIRFERMKIRKREQDPQTFREFQKTEERDLSGDGRNVEACIKMADFKIENNGIQIELYQQLECLLEKIQ